MAALAALAAHGCRQGVAAAGWRAALCALQHAQCLQPHQAQQLVTLAPWQVAGGSCGTPWVPLDTSQPWRRERQQHCCCRPPAPLHQLLHQRLLRTDSNSKGGDATGSSAPATAAAAEQQRAQRRRTAAAVAAFQAAGWSRREVVNVPNALSLGRLLSGPVIASWILDGQVGAWCRRGSRRLTRHARAVWPCC